MLQLTKEMILISFNLDFFLLENIGRHFLVKAFYTMLNGQHVRHDTDTGIHHFLKNANTGTQLYIF